jgi:uncharacterized protein
MLAMSTGRRWWLAVEFTLLFYAFPLVLWKQPHRGLILPALWLPAALCAWWLWRDRSFNRQAFWDRAERRREIWPAEAGRILFLLALAFLPLLALTIWLRGVDGLFEFPRRAPTWWALVMVLYPLLSVYPQEVVYRAFLFHRYRPLFGDGPGLLLVGATAFAFVHIVFNNPVAIALCLPGGLLFGYTYRRTRSLLLVSLEHGLYGCLIITLGLGHYFFHGTINLAGAMMPGGR